MGDEIRSFEDLNCFKNCKKLRQDISSLLKSFPTLEKLRLVDQMTRCARSVTNNIAEGYGRFHYKENSQFCRISRGSLFELLDHFEIAFEENFISLDKLNELKTQINECILILNGYIKYLSSQTK